MPLTVNVGLSRKGSRDFQSAGRSINITAELDQSLLLKPDELQAEIERLYAQADRALRTEPRDSTGDYPQGSDNGHGGSRPRNNGRNGGSRVTGRERDGVGDENGHAMVGSEGHARGQSGGQSGGRGATASQMRAIRAIADRLQLDPTHEVRDVFGYDLDGLTVREASQVIDHLKHLQGTEAARGSSTR